MLASSTLHQRTTYLPTPPGSIRPVTGSEQSGATFLVTPSTDVLTRDRRDPGPRPSDPGLSVRDPGHNARASGVHERFWAQSEGPWVHKLLPGVCPCTQPQPQPWETESTT